MDKLILRTSDRGTFRRCRQLWDFTSKIRKNWEYVPGMEALDFGTAIHAALEVHYDPERWHDDRTIVQKEAILAFAAHMHDWRKRLKKSEQWNAGEKSWKEMWELGQGMLPHFFSWSKEPDKDWEPVKVEIEFEVPIPVGGAPLPRGFRCNLDGYLEKLSGDSAYYEWLPVVYQGRIDLIVKDVKTGKYWIVDHKTAAQLGGYEHLELDTQVSSYAWAVKRVLGIDIEGVIFQELRKKVPSEPKILKTGKLSRDKSQGTTLRLYLKAIRDHGLNEAEYADFLDYLASEGQEYFRRIQLHRSSVELEIVERHVLNEALDMFDNPRIYPNPSRWNCNGCIFRDPCLMAQDGSDVDFYLEHSVIYQRRSEVDA